MNIRFTYKDSESGKVYEVAKGELDKTILDTDGSYYVDQDQVNTQNLVKTEDTYTCPYKGVCHYYSLVTDSGDVLKDQVAWVYDEPMEGWEKIAGKFGFYQYDINGISLERSEPEPAV